jgi:hypothetical protein
MRCFRKFVVYKGDTGTGDAPLGRLYGVLTGYLFDAADDAGF